MTSPNGTRCRFSKESTGIYHRYSRYCTTSCDILFISIEEVTRHHGARRQPSSTTSQNFNSTLQLKYNSQQLAHSPPPNTPKMPIHSIYKAWSIAFTILAWSADGHVSAMHASLTDHENDMMEDGAFVYSSLSAKKKALLFTDFETTYFRKVVLDLNNFD